MSQFEEGKAGSGTIPRYSLESARGRCPRCGSEWTFTGKDWLWSERSGATHLLREYHSLNEQGQPPPLTRCPCCRWSLIEPPPARVEEVKG